MVPILKILPTKWEETHIEFLTPGFVLTQVQVLWHLERQPKM